jgi:prophage regulatory protein
MRRLLSKKETAACLGLHPESVMRLSREQPGFPKPVKFGASTNCAVRFVAEEIEAWLAARIAERDAA